MFVYMHYYLLGAGNGRGALAGDARCDIVYDCLL